MIINADYLINDLIEITRSNLNHAEELKKLPLKQLNYRVNSCSWTVLECIEHLNIYGSYYLPEIERSIQQSKFKQDKVFNSSILGNYFVNLMKNGTKIKTPKDYNPLGKDLNMSSVETFINQQHLLLKLLTNTRDISLNKTKTSISISKFVKLRLGDTLRFVCFHNIRHLKQAKNALKCTAKDV